jgi:hypothetical protein
MQSCPKCSFQLADGAPECSNCGVIVAKYRGGLESVPPPLTPSSPAAASVATAMPEVSFSTLEALQNARPWLTFLAIYGFVVLGLMGVGGVVLLLSGVLNPQLLPLGAVYLLYGAIGLPVVLPLHRSAAAVRGLHRTGAPLALEGFVTHQSTFWRRAGIMTAVLLGIAIVGIALALVFGALAAATR